MAGDGTQASTVEQKYPSLAKGIFLVAVLILGYVISLLDRQVMSLLIGPIQQDMKVGDFEISLLVGFAFAIFYSLFGLPLGIVADRVNRKWLIASGMVLWSAATILCGLAGSFTILFLCRILVGVGEATFTPAAYSMLSDSFPPKRLARATAMVALGGNVGSGLALMLGGHVIDYFNTAKEVPSIFHGLAPWQSTFVVVGLPGFLVAMLVLMAQEPARRGLKSSETKASGSFRLLWRNRRDYMSFYFAGMGLATVTYCGYSWFPTHMIRSFGLPAGEAGKLIGMVQLVATLCGTLLSVYMVEFFLRRGRSDAHLLTIMLLAGGIALTTVTLLMPNVESTLIMWFFSSVLQHSYFGILMAGLQIITPNSARGANSAVYLLLTTLVGLGVGAALVGAISQYAFPGDPRGIGYGIGIISFFAASAACVAALWGLSHQRQIAKEQLGLTD